MIPYLMMTLIPASTHWFYNYHMFSYAGEAMKRRVLTRKMQGLTFLGNFLTFLIISHFGFPLICNWFVFAAVLVLEARAIYRIPFENSVYCGVQGALVGLSVNLITRSIAAWTMGQTLMAFDSISHTGSMLDNYKWIPISFGFLISGLFFWGMRVWIQKGKVEMHRIGKENVRFANRLLLAIFGYLALNLLIFSQDSNELIIKLWGIKSGVCALVAFYVGLYYIVELNRLKRFEFQSTQVREELDLHKSRAEMLSEIAYVDSLTGCYSWKFGKKKLEEALAGKTPFCICFADLNELKVVNDTLGHDAGDKYLSAAAHALGDTVQGSRDILCRYGGDEFLLIFYDRPQESVELLLAEADHELKELSWSSEYPFELSVSYGVVIGNGFHELEQLLAEADRKMYRHKEAHAQQRQDER